MTLHHTISNQSLRHAIETKLVPIVEAVTSSYDLAGLALGIVSGGEILLAQGFGKRNVETGEPVTPHSLFHMASVSKPFVATAMMQLVEADMIDLQAPVVRYLPYFRLADERYPTITLQQMLSHTSGMPDTDDYHWYAPEYDDGALERYVRTLASAQLLHAPDERFDYSNVAFE